MVAADTKAGLKPAVWRLHLAGTIPAPHPHLRRAGRRCGRY